jgi:4-amino-4-deoxy-L-arabinose transferase-like glycosyltransferase
MTNILPIALVLAIIIGISLRIWSCFAAFGIWDRGDEAEYVNMTWLMVHGYGWPSLDLRSPFFPLLLHFPLSAAALLAIKGNSVMLLCRLFNSIFSLSLIFSSYVFAKEIYSEKVAAITAILISFSAPIIEWTPRVMTEVPAIALVFASFALTAYSLRKKSYLTMIFAGSILGFSYLTRFTFAVFLIPILIYLLIKRKTALAGGFIVGFLAVFIFGGALDYLIWGEFYHAPLQFFEYNVILGLDHTSLDVLYYIRNLAWYVTPLGLVLSVFGLKKDKRTLLMLTLVGTFLLMISFTPNYQLRYGLLLAPLLIVLASNGLLELAKYLERVVKRLPATKTIMRALPFLVGFAMICLSLIQTFNAPYVFNGDAANAALFLNEQTDVKGVITVDFACKMGEYIFLQKDVPIYEYTTQSLSTLEEFCNNANYIIVMNEWYLQINSGANEIISSYNFVDYQRFNGVYVLKKT